MILLLGGTAETSELAQRLSVLPGRIFVSTATGAALALPDNANIIRVTGRKDRRALEEFIRAHSIDTLICAVHPYAAAAREEALQAAKSCGCKFFVYLRKESDVLEFADIITPVFSHQEAAAHACGNNPRVLLTTGSRNLAPYLKQAQIHNCKIFARLLDCAETRQTLAQLGMNEQNVIFGRGPFSYEDNLRHLEAANASALVTKDGGDEGGMQEKLRAAQTLGARVLLVRRPPYCGNFFTNIAELAREVIAAYKQNGEA